jgi:hypothetical protein
MEIELVGRERSDVAQELGLTRHDSFEPAVQFREHARKKAAAPLAR